MLQPIAIDTSSFPELRKTQCVYVDKTAYFHRLITRLDARRFFIARPRRFGKSLMISTLKALFEGRRELFDGLAITKTDWAWESYPVLYFNMGFAASSTAEGFKQNFPSLVSHAIKDAGGQYNAEESPASNFGFAIDSLSSGNRKVVILIDEYDDPVAQLLAKSDEAEEVRGIMADFYRQMKDRTDKIRFLMITGVSKFTKMSVFSALSNLVDLSFEDECACMLGYTEEELDEFFGNHMKAHAVKRGLSDENYRKELKLWFNGYRFGRYTNTTVYNPVSIGVNLSTQEPVFRSCWSSTGKAAMLMNYLKREEFLGVDMDNVQNVQEQDFDVTDIRALRTVPMLFQTGYLTIKDYEPLSGTYNLTVPDVEVRKDLAMLTSSVIANKDSYWVSNLGVQLLKGQWEPFFTGLRSLYAALPYGSLEANVHECSFERVLLTLLWSQAIQGRTEDRQANGQADIVAIHPCGIYIFELKVDASADEALEQVRAKNYDMPYRASGLPIWIAGLNFDRKTRHLKDAKAERLTAH
ncbi:MAG: AAA family ATPase [Victivallales bacterium]|nr:AAA family ATPase [Victivallales bacterium]